MNSVRDITTLKGAGPNLDQLDTLSPLNVLSAEYAILAPVAATFTEETDPDSGKFTIASGSNTPGFTASTSIIDMFWNDGASKRLTLTCTAVAGALISFTSDGTGDPLPSVGTTVYVQKRQTLEVAVHYGNPMFAMSFETSANPGALGQLQVVMNPAVEEYDATQTIDANELVRLSSGDDVLSQFAAPEGDPIIRYFSFINLCLAAGTFKMISANGT